MEKVLYIENMITPYSIKKFNLLNNKFNGNFIVWFQTVTEINRNWKNFPKIYFKYEFLNNFTLRLKGNDTFSFYFNYSFFKKLKNYNPDIIILGGWEGFSSFYIAFWGKIHNKKVILSCESTKYEMSWRRTFTKPLIKLLIKICSSYLAAGTRSKEYLEILGADPNKIQILNLTVDVDFFKNKSDLFKIKKNQIKKKLGINTKYVLIFVGQLINRKGIWQLLDGFMSFQKEFGDISLLVVGSGVQENNMKAYIKKNNINNVLFFGFKQINEMPKYYAISDIFILPSLEEVWGLVINEAMACGLPIITTNIVGSSPDLVFFGKNGYIMDKCSSNEIYNGLKYIINNNLVLKNNSFEIISKFRIDDILNKINF